MGAAVSGSPLSGKTVYFPSMSEAGVRVIAAAFRSVGIDAKSMPPSDEETMVLGGRHSSGEECLPLKVTLGDALKLLVHGKIAPDRMAIFMPTSDGPCRFGQYGPYIKEVLKEMGYDGVTVVSPTCEDGYSGVGEHADELLRTAWRAMIAGELLTKLLLRTRPYELEKGASDAAYQAALSDLCATVESRGKNPKERMARLKESLVRGRRMLRDVRADFSDPRPLIGVVGEIFCRLNTFSNDDVVRKVEEAGGECWISDVSEWLWYTNAAHLHLLKRFRKHLTFEMFGARLKWHFQHKDERDLYTVFGDDFRGYEEADDIRDVLDLARPYLVPEGTLGEMLLSVAKTVYLHRKGADGVLDINPFSCMNGIVSEAIYPRLSRDCDGLPVRVFYFDGTRADRRYELDIFMDLVREYSARKRTVRTLPPGLGRAAAFRGSPPTALERRHPLGHPCELRRPLGGCGGARPPPAGPDLSPRGPCRVQCAAGGVRPLGDGERVGGHFREPRRRRVRPRHGPELPRCGAEGGPLVAGQALRGGPRLPFPPSRPTFHRGRRAARPRSSQ